MALVQVNNAAALLKKVCFEKYCPVLHLLRKVLTRLLLRADLVDPFFFLEILLLIVDD
jgi:hypothetical protein